MKFIYTNYKGETEERDVDVTAIDFLSNPRFGYEPGWFITGRDRKRNGQVRSFRIDGRMLPTDTDMSVQMAKGLSAVEYLITEGHHVREAVDQIKQRVVEELAAQAPKFER